MFDNFDFSMTADAAWVGFAHQNFDHTVKRDMHRQTPLLGRLLQGTVRSRTPIDTGALYTGVDYEANTDNIESEDLIVMLEQDAPQMAAWDRIYVEYQEGGALGKPTYTNAPHEMFARIQTEDLGVIESWGVVALEASMLRLALLQGDTI